MVCCHLNCTLLWPYEFDIFLLKHKDKCVHYWNCPLLISTSFSFHYTGIEESRLHLAECVTSFLKALLYTSPSCNYLVYNFYGKNNGPDSFFHALQWLLYTYHFTGVKQTDVIKCFFFFFKVVHKFYITWLWSGNMKNNILPKQKKKKVY